MSFLPDFFAQIQNFIAGVKAAVGKFFHKAIKKEAKLRARMQPVADGIVKRIPPERRRPVLIASMGVISFFMLILIGLTLLEKDNVEKQTAAVEGMPVRQGLIPPDQLFLPDEPDFVPGVILEREQRTTWTAGDVAPLWQDPLKNGEEPWRDGIEKAIDEIMETVP